MRLLASHRRSAMKANVTGQKGTYMYGGVWGIMLGLVQYKGICVRVGHTVLLERQVTIGLEQDSENRYV